MVAIFAIVALVIIFVLLNDDDDTAGESPTPGETTTMRVIDRDFLLG